jgi:ubiquinone/menaquinone biosynthesis C-methylase UbiE
VIVSLVRMMSAGVTLLIGTVVLIFQVRTLTTPATTDSREHFNEIANEYRRQFSPHMWSTLADRRIALIQHAAGPPQATGIGLDLGCGFGEHRGALEARGYRVVGVDAATHLLQLARSRGSMLSAGSALSLPFRRESFDFVYTIGVLHHLPGEAAQETAFGEVMRVLKPGGVFIVQETNPRNVLFRFYMGYVFPILKSIDDGTEWWIEPARWTVATGMTLQNIRYFTFMPDFVPRIFMRPTLALERRLEASRFRTGSVHYMAVLQKPVPAGGPPRMGQEM